jgi:hypothetical protein
MADSVLIDALSEPLSGATTAKVDIDSGTGNLTVNELTGDEQVLASGTLQYVEHQGRPTRTLESSQGQASLTLRGRGSGRSWFRFPWAACTGATEWKIYLNPTVASDLTAHTDGGDVKLNLAGMAVTRLAADTGGGNLNVALPDSGANLRVSARTGAGNVTVEIGSGTTGTNTIDANSGAGNVLVRVPSGMAVKVLATSGLGRVTVDSRFSEIDRNTYQSPDYDGAVDKVEITVHSGAGNVSVNTKQVAGCTRAGSVVRPA